MYKLLLLTTFLFCLTNSTYSQYTKLFDFKRDSTGSHPYQSFVSDGTYLYGILHLGGTYDDGTIFKIKPDGSEFELIFEFNDSLSGFFPNGNLLYDGTYLYATTVYGGEYGKGTIIKIKTDGTDFTKLIDFNGANGYSPSGTLVSDGTFLYGTTGIGGTNGDGVLYKLKPDGTDFSILHHFESTTSGSSVYGSLLLDGNYLYGMTTSGGITATPLEGGDGTIYKVKTDGSDFTKLLDFTGNNGSYPHGSLITDGTYLYGMTRQGGPAFNGNLFKIKQDGSDFQNLMYFNSDSGRSPEGTLRLINSTLYGLTWGGGEYDNGVLFQVQTDGSDYIKLHEFPNTGEGKNPYGSLFYENSTLYSMTYTGGLNNHGTIFKYALETLVSQKEPKGNIISIFPNPVNTILTVEAPVGSQVIIYDMQGKIVHSFINHSKLVRIDVQHLQKGWYNLKTITQNQAQNHRFVVMGDKYQLPTK